MDPLEIFEQRLLLNNGLAIAHLMRCADNAGILDEDAKKSLRTHFNDLSKDAEATGSEAVLEWLDAVVRALPPLR